MKPLIIFFLLSFSPLIAQDVVIIVNEQNPITEITRDQIRNFFLKNVRQWPSGTPVRFFDMSDTREERRYFLRQYVKKTPREVDLYWIGQKLYSGNSAPLQISSDAMIAGVVSRFPGAIGYVSSAFTEAPGVKKISIKKD
ncbi:MAG: substrate-binding domain-containing protein [Bacteriovorax sp.]|jgi:ABC-type phosphate transport system substrate-binding protein